MKKYNIKIKNLLFLSLVAMVIFLPMKNVWAGVDFCIGAKGEEGICQSWCSGVSVKDEKGSIECAEANYVQNTCCIDPKTAPLEITATGVSNLSQNTGTSNEVYQKPSLIKCNEGEGLCYGSVECPSGLYNLGDKFNICGNGKYTACCRATAGASCGGSGACVDEGVLCTNEIKSASSGCGSKKKCCSIYIPQNNIIDNDPITVKASSPVTYGSQCDSNNKNCKKDNDSAILANQCQNLFTAAECASMPTYLGSLTNKCLQMKPAGIDCAMINSGGAYGNEASKFANYYIQNSTNSPSAGGTTPSAGGLDFDTIAQMGLPDSPGVKSILVNVMKWMLEIIGLITLIAFIISGGQYLLSAGDETAMQKAKKNMTYSIIGIIVALSGFVIIRAIDTALRAVPGKMF